MSTESLKKHLFESAQNLQALANSDEQLKKLQQASQWAVECLQKGGKILLAGNGGSAADAQHIAAELVAKLSRDRTSFPALALTVDTSLLTAVGNDYGYDFVFDRQLQGLARPEDLFIALTTSGNSKNILQALERARKMKIRSVLFTGFKGGKASELADLTLCAPGAHTARIQEAHMALYHAFCFEIEEAMVASGHAKYLD